MIKYENALRASERENRPYLSEKPRLRDRERWAGD